MDKLTGHVTSAGVLGGGRGGGGGRLSGMPVHSFSHCFDVASSSVSL